MRIALSKRECYHADIYCRDGTSAKKTLRENHISILAVDFYLHGRENGTHVLAWARAKQLLPAYVVVTESDRNKRILLAEELTKGGYCSVDGTTFIKH